MKLLEIPFVKKVGIERNSQNQLELSYNPAVYNHLDTIHASAQFTLAETASGEILQSMFPNLVGKVIPVLRDSTVKFKNPAIKSVSAHAFISDEAVEKFNRQFSTKSRALILVDVVLKDNEDTITCTGQFSWFVQAVDM